MRTIGKRGLFSVFMAVTAITLILFAINTSIAVPHNTNPFLKLEAGRSTEIKAENFVRIADDKIGDLFEENLNVNPATPCNANQITLDADQIEEGINALGFPDCQITGTNRTAGTITGTITCTAQIKNFDVVETRNFSTTKIIDGDPGACTAN